MGEGEKRRKEGGREGEEAGRRGDKSESVRE